MQVSCNVCVLIRSWAERSRSPPSGGGVPPAAGTINGPAASISCIRSRTASAIGRCTSTSASVIVEAAAKRAVIPGPMAGFEVLIQSPCCSQASRIWIVRCASSAVPRSMPSSTVESVETDDDAIAPRRASATVGSTPSNASANSLAPAGDGVVAAGLGSSASSTAAAERRRSKRWAKTPTVSKDGASGTTPSMAIEPCVERQPMIEQ